MSIARAELSEVYMITGTLSILPNIFLIKFNIPANLWIKQPSILT